MYFADLHIHSRFSRATSRDCDLPHLDWWARRKGIGLLGTGDFTHPGWRAELKEQLVLAGEGVYELKEAYRLPCGVKGETPRFVVTGEISSIYKRGGKTRKVHNLILLPSLEAADALSARLEAVGNIRSDGRPILGMDSRDLMELTLDVCPDAEFIPAHIWTPHFSMFGASPALDKLCGAAVFYASFPALFETLLWGEEADFLRASGKGWESGAVRLMTLHAAKGMEFPAVFVSGVKAGVLPLERKGRAVDLCEERRLFYVGMTRAEQELILTFGEEPSAFLADLPDSVKRQCAPRRARPAQQLSLFS